MTENPAVINVNWNPFQSMLMVLKKTVHSFNDLSVGYEATQRWALLGAGHFRYF